MPRSVEDYISALLTLNDHKNYVQAVRTGFSMQPPVKQKNKHFL